MDQNEVIDSSSEKMDFRQFDEITQLAYKADRLLEIGFKEKAERYVIEGFNCCQNKTGPCDPPATLLDKYNAKNPEILFVKLCEASLGHSSYFARDIFDRIYYTWFNQQYDDPEVCLKLGLLLSLKAKRQNLQTPKLALKLLTQANEQMNNERSATALALASGEIKGFASIPYDQARIHLYPDLSIISTYVLLEQNDWFEHGDLELFRNLIKPSDNILDIGANVGTFTISAATRTKEHGKVVSVEPVRHTYELLRKSAKPLGNVIAVHAALSGENGTGFISYGNGPELCSLKDVPDENGENVRLTTLDDLAAANDIDSFDIIKMDAEGHEEEIIKGSQKSIIEKSPIIFYEYKAGAKINYELIDAFSDIGYDSYYYVAGTSTLYKYRKGLPLDGYLLNMIAFKPESLHRFEGIAKIDDAQNHAKLAEGLL